MTTEPDKQVIRLLLTEWEEGLRITTIPQALSRLGLPDDEETRWRISGRLKRAWRRRLSVRGVWRGLRWLRDPERQRPRTWLAAARRLPSLIAEARHWNPAVYILSNDEKLIARHLLQTGQVSPSEALAEALEIDEATANAGLRMLVRIGFLARAAGSYRLASNHQPLLEGLGFNFHTVTLESGEQFNVP